MVTAGLGIDLMAVYEVVPYFSLMDKSLVYLFARQVSKRKLLKLERLFYDLS